MEISTVNFDDLFDFSPEPLEPSSPQSHLYPQPLTLRTPLSPSEIPLVLKNKIIIGDADKLSQSVPSNWGGIHFVPSNRTAQQTDTFDTSVGQLLADLPSQGELGSTSTVKSSSSNNSSVVTKGKRGRKPGQKNLKTDMKSKLERSRQSARECRARKKLRYQYLDDLILEREKANIKLRNELLKYLDWCHELDKGIIPDGLLEVVNEFKKENS